MEADAERKVNFEPQRPMRRSLSEFLVDIIIGLFRLIKLPFSWLNVQRKIVLDDKKKKDNFTRWLTKHQRRENRRLRYNNEF